MLGGTQRSKAPPPDEKGERALAEDMHEHSAENHARCGWAADRLPHTAHGACKGLLPHLAEGLQRLMDHQARVIPPGSS